MEMTIKQLANQLGVSKTTISKAIFALGLQGELKQSSNKYLLSEVQIESVKTQTANQNALIEFFQKQLGIKDDQIRTHQEQIRLLQEQIVSKDKQIEQIIGCYREYNSSTNSFSSTSRRNNPKAAY